MKCNMHFTFFVKASQCIDGYRELYYKYKNYQKLVIYVLKSLWKSWYQFEVVLYYVGLNNQCEKYMT